METVKRFFSQCVLYWKGNQGPFDLVEFLALKIGYSVLSLAFYCIVAKFANDTADLARWVVGNSFALCVVECINVLGVTFNDERYNGRLKIIVTSPTNELAIVFQKSVFPMLINFASIAFVFVIGVFIFGVDLSHFNIGAFALCMLAATFATAGLGLLCSVFALITDSMYLLLNAIASFVIIFSGANFPVSQLPIPMQWIAHIFPLYRSVQAANMCLTEIDWKVFWRLFAGEALLGLVLYFAAFVLLKIIESYAVKNATLEVF